MSLNRTRPNETREPEFVELPDGRKRLVRFFALPNGTNITDGLVQAWGTADAGPATGTTAGFAGLRLVDQRLVKINEQSFWQATFEEIPATAEVQVGGNTTLKLTDGRTGYEAEFLQFSAGTYTPGTVGTTTAPGDANAFLQKEEATSDGTLRRIKRTYIYAGTIRTSTEFKNNGLLELRTIVSVKTVPSTPGGFTLVSTQADPSAGLPVYTYTFAQGVGEISRSVDYSQSGDQGTTGITRTTIRYLVAPAGTIQPTTLSGSVLVGQDVSEQDGHRVWVTTWAKGIGEISRSVDYSQSGDQGTTGITRTTIRYLVAPAGTIQPTSLSGSVLVGQDVSEQDGHRVWVTQWAKGIGEISRSVDYSQSSDQGTTGITRTTIRYLVAPAGTIQPTTLSGSVLVGQDVSEQAGHRVWVTTWAKGIGEISRSIDYSQSSDEGTTGITRTTIRYLVAPAGTIQPTTLSGSVLVGQDVSEQDGHRVWVTTWVKGLGAAGVGIRVREDSSIVYTVTDFAASATTPAYPGSGTAYLVQLDQEPNSGYFVNRATYIKLPPDYTRPIQVEFRKPGLIVAANPPTITPPCSLDLIGTETVSYSTSQNAAVVYKISSYCSVYEIYKRSLDGAEFSKVDDTPGYLGSSTLVGTNTVYRGISVLSFNVTVSASSPTTLPTGVQTVRVGCEKYLTATNGTVIWRNSTVTADVT
jgi:hypothetical protein